MEARRATSARAVNNVRHFRINSGSLAMLAAMRRASSRVSSLAADWRECRSLYFDPARSVVSFSGRPVNYLTAPRKLFAVRYCVLVGKVFGAAKCE